MNITELPWQEIPVNTSPSKYPLGLYLLKDADDVIALATLRTLHGRKGNMLGFAVHGWSDNQSLQASDDWCFLVRVR